MKENELRKLIREIIHYDSGTNSYDSIFDLKVRVKFRTKEEAINFSDITGQFFEQMLNADLDYHYSIKKFEVISIKKNLA